MNMNENIFTYSQPQNNQLTSLNRPKSLKLQTLPDGFKNSDLKLILEQPYTATAAAVINSPQFEKFLSQLPTPSPLTPTRFLNPNVITQEEESFANDFSQKLIQIKQERENTFPDNQHRHLTSQNKSEYDEDSMSTTSSAYHFAPDNSASCQPPNGPVLNLLGHPAAHRSSSIASSSMTDQCSSNDTGNDGHLHKIKIERKRARNRDAARKCRERKMERIVQLEQHKAELLESNKALQKRISEYASEVQNLKRFVMNNLKVAPKKILTN